MKIQQAIVTGAAGFIGKVLVRRLLELKIPVRAVLFPGETRCEPVETLVLDLRQPQALEPHLDSQTTVFHLAARADVAGSVKDPRDDFNVNVSGFFEVLESIRSKKAKLIFPSTASVFDPSNPLPLSENAIQKPNSPYGAAKIAAEAYCRAYHHCYQTDIRIARLFSVYGEGMKRFVIRDLVRKLQQNPKDLVLLGDGSQIRDYLHVEDAVDGLICIAENGKTGEDYNLASGIPTAIIDLARSILNHLQLSQTEIRFTGEFMPGEIPKWFANPTKIKNIGFAPKIPLEEGLKRTINWLIQNPD